MALPVSLQSVQFLLSVLLGACYGVGFDCLRGMVRSLPPLTHLLDLLFVVAVLLSNLLFALVVGRGEYRIFMAVGTGLGALLYFLTLSHLLCPLFSTIFRWISAPFVTVGGFMKKILGKIRKKSKKPFSTGKKSFIINRTHRMTQTSNGEEENRASL